MGDGLQRAVTLCSMHAPLNVLLVEDCEDDALLVLDELRRGGYDVTHVRVRTAAGMTAALAERQWDMVIAEYALPQFSGAAALDILQRSGLDPPFIIVSGTMGADAAVAAMKAGAHDYIMKSNLARLAPAVERELRDAAVRRERFWAAQALQDSEDLNRAVLRSLTAQIAVLDNAGCILAVNEAWRRAASGGGCVLDIGVGANYLERLQTSPGAVADAEAVVRGIRSVLDGSEPHFALEYSSGTAAGTRWFVLHATPLLGRQGGVVLSHIDATEGKLAAQRTAVMVEVAKDVSGTFDIAVLLERVERRMAEAMPCDAVVTFYWDEVRGLFRVLSQHGLPAAWAAQMAALEVPPGQLFYPADPGRTVVVNDMLGQSLLPHQLWDYFHVGSLIAAPLLAHGNRVGALMAVRFGAERPFDGAQVELCQGIARHLALAMEAVELYRAQQQEAQVSGALARVGEVLISSFDTPALLERLCRVTAEVLGCDISHTVLRQPADDLYVPIAEYGGSPEEREAARVVGIPAALISEVLTCLEHDDVAEATVAPDSIYSSAPGSTLTDRLYLCMALRHGKELIGVQTAYRRDRTDPFSPQQRRIAAGIAQLASLVLAHARLVDELERAGRLKSDFVATMSHELRTPLNAIMGYNDLLLEGAFGKLKEEQREPLRRIAKSAADLLELINTTLDVSRIEAGRLPVDLKEFGLSDLLAQIRTETQDLQSKPGVRFRWNLPPALPRLRSDPIKVKVVLKNLIANAVKFTEHGSVTVEAHKEGRGVEIAVTDTGIGIPPEAQSLIFEPFRQADSSATRRYGGVGLGLYITRRFLEMLGGTVTVDSETGRGSTFRIWLPANGQSAAADAQPTPAVRMRATS